MHQQDHKTGLPLEIRFRIIVTSDLIATKQSRSEPFEDVSGDLALSLTKEFGGSQREYLANDADAIRASVQSAASGRSSDVIVVIGGTGIGRRDVSVEAVSPLFEKTLPGFGELFRRLSFDSVGTSAMASRATSGVANGCLIFVLPGSPQAVKLALQKIIIPESPHLIKMIRG